METQRKIAAVDYLPVVCSFLLALALSVSRMADSDLWCHLKCGEYFFQHGSILKTYYYNCSWPGFPYLNHEWLFQAIIYSLYHAFGEIGLVALQAGLILLAFAILYKTLRLYSDSILLISVVLALGILASSHRFALRPQHFSYVFFLYNLFALHRYRRGEVRYVYLLPVVMAFWVNIHAESLWGIVIPAIFLSVEFFRSAASRRTLKPLSIVFILVVCASLLNPYTYKTVLWPLFVMKEQFAGVEELLSPTQPRFFYFWIYFTLFVVSLFAALRRTDVTWAVVSLLFAIVAWIANRGIPHFVFASAPLIVMNVHSVLTRYKPNINPLVGWGLRLLFLGGIGFVLFGVLTSPFFLKKYERVSYPEGALHFMKENGIRAHILNEHVWGCFIIWNSYPDLKPYIDGRFVHKRFFEEFDRILHASEGWERLLSTYNITVALMGYSKVGTGTLNDVLFSDPHWRLVYWDDVSLLYLKDVSENRDVVERFGNTVINPDRQLFYEYDRSPQNFVELARSVTERDLEFAGTSYKALILSANTYFRLGDYGTALRRYGDALKHIPSENPWVYYKIALCYRYLGDLKETKEYITKTLDLAPDFGEGKRLLQEILILEAR